MNAHMKKIKQNQKINNIIDGGIIINGYYRKFFIKKRN